MKNDSAVKKLDKKTVVAILIATVCLAVVILSAVIAGHTTYEKNCEAKILNYDTDFKATSPQTLTYYYEDGIGEIDLADVVKLSAGATFSVTKIQDEDMTVTKAEGTKVDVSVHPQRLAAVSVVSKNGVGKTDYRITVVPKSYAGNVIEFNVVDGQLDLDDIFLNYSGNYRVELPIPKKIYFAAENIPVEYDFLGWYTTPDYQEGTEITAIEAGHSGEVKLYARFADASKIYTDAEGYSCINIGYYPQTRVRDYAEISAIKNIENYDKWEQRMFTFTYNGEPKRYYKFKPKNVANLGANGYNAQSSYLFYVEPVVWRILEDNGSILTLLSKNILNGSIYSTNDETLLQKLYDLLEEKLNGKIDSFIRYYFDGDTMYGREGGSSGFLELIKFSVPSNALREAMKAMANGIFRDYMPEGENLFNTNAIVKRTFKRYTSVFNDDTENYDDYIWPLSYSEAINTGYGFSSDYEYNDPLRKAMVSDFAAANGVYIATSTAHKGQGSWWLRGAGGTQGQEKGNFVNGYGFRDKRIAYVKYTGYVHAYGALNYNILSGMRPACRVDTTKLPNFER